MVRRALAVAGDYCNFCSRGGAEARRRKKRVRAENAEDRRDLVLAAKPPSWPFAAPAVTNKDCLRHHISAALRVLCAE
jgi:hypothetical protein